MMREPLREYPKPLGNDWYNVPWSDVYERTKLSPLDVPGVIPFEPRRPPYFTKVHRTHLKLLGYNTPISAVNPDLDSPLRLHQIEARNFITNRRGTLLADEPRVGKTASIMYAHNPDDGVMLVIGPLAARAIWHEWAARRFGSCGVASCSICARVGAKKASRPSFTHLEGRTIRALELQPNVIFLHFQIANAWRELYDKIEIGTLVVDEAHLAGAQARKSQTNEAIRWFNTTAKRVVFATGTPIFNKPRGLWPLLDIITPGAFGSFWDFARRYAGACPTAFGWTAEGSSNLDELKTRLEQVMLRRTWKDIQGSLPPITRSVEIVPLPQEVKDETDAVAASLRSVNASTFVGDLARLRKMYADCKLAATIVLVDQLVKEGHNVVVWTWHKDIAMRLATLLGADVITGDTIPRARETILEYVRETSRVRPTTLVATMGALGTGVNLNWASHEVFVELDWTPANMAQAEMRPFDGTKPIQAIYMVADVDVEQRLVDALLSKLTTMGELGLQAGVGDVAETLKSTLKIDDVVDLNMLAQLVMDEAG